MNQTESKSLTNTQSRKQIGNLKSKEDSDLIRAEMDALRKSLTKKKNKKGFNPSTTTKYFMTNAQRYLMQNNQINMVDQNEMRDGGFHGYNPYSWVGGNMDDMNGSNYVSIGQMVNWENNENQRSAPYIPYKYDHNGQNLYYDNSEPLETKG